MDISLPVTRTKILVPRRRAELLTRKRLLDALNDLLENKLIIVAAPAGYGKTSLLIDFAHQTEYPLCWVALDPLDKDPQRFIGHFIASLKLLFPKFGKNSISALQSMTQDRLNLDALAAVIANEAYEHINEHFVFVLDDYHLVDDSTAVNHFISRFIQDVDENCHLIVTSRTLLTLPDLPLLVAHNQVGGLSFEELAFQPFEIQGLLLKNYHMTISESTAAGLAQQTEGWITGLLLSTETVGMATGDRLRVARVSGVGLYEYLAEQVLERQPAPVQEFLLRTSLLEEFDSSSCQEIIGAALSIEKNWDALMDQVLRRNLFVLPVGDERMWLRYHHLFRDFLQAHMQRERPEETELILVRLAEVFVTRQEWESAYNIYQRLGRTEAVANLIEQSGSFLVAAGKLVTLTDWLKALPEELISTRPALLSLQGSVALMREDIQAGLRLFNQVISALQNDGDAYQLALTLCRRSAAYRLLGEFQSALQDADQAMDLSRDNKTMKVVWGESLHEKGNNLYQQGQLKEARTWLNRSFHVFHALNDKQSVANIQNELGLVNQALGDYTASEQAFASSLQYWQSRGNSAHLANLLNNIGVLEYMRGDYESAASTIDKSIQYAKNGGSPRIEAYALSSLGDLYRDVDASQAALEAYQKSQSIVQHINERYLSFLLDIDEAVLARIQGHFAHAHTRLHSAEQKIEQGGGEFGRNLYRLEWGGLEILEKNYEIAIPELEEAARFFEKESHLVEAARAHLFLAVASHALEDSASALSHLNQALQIIPEPENRMPLVVTARELRPLLESMQAVQGPGLLAANLIVQINRYEERLPVLRRHLRRLETVVPFAAPHIVIRSLGKIEVRVNNRLVTVQDWTSPVARDLFFYLLAHPDGVTKEQAGVIFWPEATPADLKLRFKNSMYRLRHAIGKDVIEFENDYYRFNRNLDFEFDVESFLKELAEAEQEAETRPKMAHLRSALRFYRGTYMPLVEGTWFLVERERLHQIYIEALLSYTNLQLETMQYEAALTSCQQALNEDPYLEAAHRLAMRAHAALGNNAAVVRQYELCSQKLLNDIGTTPSPQTQALYEALLQ